MGRNYWEEYETSSSVRSNPVTECCAPRAALLEGCWCCRLVGQMTGKWGVVMVGRCACAMAAGRRGRPWEACVMEWHALVLMEALPGFWELVLMEAPPGFWELVVEWKVPDCRSSYVPLSLTPGRCYSWSWESGKSLNSYFFEIHLALRPLTKQTSFRHAVKSASFSLTHAQSQECWVLTGVVGVSVLLREAIPTNRYWEAVVWNTGSGTTLPAFKPSSAA